MTPDQIGIVIADRFLSGEYTGRDNLALHISSAINQAMADERERYGRGQAMTPEKIERNFEVCGLKLAKEATKLIIALCEYSASEERKRACQAIRDHGGFTDDEKRIAIEVIRTVKDTPR
jgi:hypothetical protein